VVEEEATTESKGAEVKEMATGEWSGSATEQGVRAEGYRQQERESDGGTLRGGTPSLI
jgi:hypothetical protein